MYKYYIEVELEEHLLYAEEICEILKPKYPHISPSLIATKYSKYCKDNNVENHKMFYNRRNGLKRVYPLSLIVKALEGEKC